MAAALVLTGCTSAIKTEAGKGYHQIVVLSDVHIPGNNLPIKEKAIQTVNSWNDVDMVAVTGDIVATGGSPEQFAAAKRFFSKLKKPLRVVGGNHDYIYPDSYPPQSDNGPYPQGSLSGGQEKEAGAVQENLGVKGNLL